MKKLISILLAMLLLLSLCGCGAEPEKMHIECCGEEVTELVFVYDEEYTDEELTLTVSLEPEGTKAKTEWTSSDRLIAKAMDNGDGTCTLRLRDIGETDITAACGSLSATVTVKVLAEIPVEPVYIPDNPFEGYTVLHSENSVGACYTPNDIINSGVLSSRGYYGNLLLSHFEAINSGNARGRIELGDGFLEYRVADSYFTTLYTASGDFTAAYNFNYKNGYITSITAEFGDGETCEITFEGRYGDVKSMSVKYSDGTVKKISKKGEEAGYKQKEGGFHIGFGLLSAPTLTIGESDSYGYYAEVRMNDDYIDKGMVILQILVEDPANNANYRISTNKVPEFASCGYTIVSRTEINGNKCYFELSGGQSYFKYTDPESGQMLAYYFKPDGSYDHGFFVPEGADKGLKIDADGNEIE